MKAAFRVILPIALFGTSLVLVSPAVPATPDAYWMNSDGTVWRNSAGECWRTRFWTQEQALPQCEGGAVLASEPPPEPEPKDSDGDGIVDSRDACPGTAIGVRVDERGCALKERIELEGVTFATGSAVLDATSVDTLDEMTATLRRYPDMRVEIQGHTDSQGDRDFNVQLSQQRAEAVRMYLINKGIDADRLRARGYGPNQPVASNATAGGRAQNRRVEMVVIE